MKPVYFCDPEKNTECGKRFCAYKPETEAGCFATSKKECARTDFNGQPCAIPRWVLAKERESKIFRALEKFDDSLRAIRKAVFHKNNAGGR